MIVADRILLSMVVGLPLLLGMLSRIVPGDSGLSLLSAGYSPAGILDNSEAAQRITLLIVSGTLMGTAITIRELVAERAIFRREYATGVSADVYLLAKLVVFGGIAFAQGVLVTALATAGLPGPDFGRLRSG